MSQVAAGEQPRPSSGQSTGELVKQLSEQVSVLVRDEMKLAQKEMTRKGKQAGVGIGMFGASGLAALYGAGCLIACVILAISIVLAPWLAALIVGAALLVVAGVAALAGRRHVKRATPPMPDETAESLKADVAAIKEGTRR